MIDFIKLLPAHLRTTRWADIVKASQQVLVEDVQPQNIDPIQTRIQFENMTTQDLKDMIYFLGYPLVQSDGYTNTDEFLRRQVLTVVPRILNRSANKTYQYVYYIYNLLGEVYPLILENNGKLNPFLDWLTVPETEDQVFLLDTGRFLDEGQSFILYYQADLFDTGLLMDDGNILDNFVPVFGTGIPGTDWSLDEPGLIGSLTRHFLLSYSFRFVETSTEFITTNTARAFYNDVIQSKSKVEIPHFQPQLIINANADNSVRITTYTSEDGTITANQEAILIGVGLNLVDKIRFGNGGHTVVDASITDVENFVQEFALTDLDVDMQTGTELNFSTQIFATTMFFDFSEIAFMDSLNNVILYAKFPYVRFASEMLSSLELFSNVL